MSSAAKVMVLNPNSSESVTRAIDRAVQASAAAARCRFESVTATDGPPGIVTQDDYKRASGLVGDYLERHRHSADAFVVACFSDPGVQAARAVLVKPVIGLGESGLRAALQRGRRAGVIAVADASIPRHLRYWQVLGLQQHVAGERALNLRVDQSGDLDLAFGRMCEAGLRLRKEDGADVLLLGCAGMADLRVPLERELGMPVVDPCQAAADAALAALVAGGKGSAR